MRGYIKKRGKNSYSVVISLGKDNNGKYKQHWVSVNGNKKDAERKRTELLHQLDNNIVINPRKITVVEYLKRWLADYAKPKLSPRSYERYEGIVNLHLIPGIGSLLLSQLRSEHVQRHYAEELRSGLSASTVKYEHTVIHKALETALKWSLISHNIADGVDIPRPRHKEINTWNEHDVNNFLEAAKDSIYYPLFHTALFTGMRRSELLGLQWKDIGLDQISVNRALHLLRDGTYVFTQPKSEKSRRTIALSPSSVITLTEHKQKQRKYRSALGLSQPEDDLVFSTAEGKPFRPDTVSRAWATMAARAGVKVIRLHDARHTHASLMLKQGVHPKIVQERLGHSSIQITLDTYSHVAPGLQEAAAESFEKLISPSYNRVSENVANENNY